MDRDAADHRPAPGGPAERCSEAGGWAVPGGTTGAPAADFEAPYARVASVALMQEALGRWLLLRLDQPSELWAPPGGRLERGESLEQALFREMEEETGLDFVNLGPCYAYLTVHKGERLVAVTFACRVSGEAPAVRLEEGEAIDWKWATTDEWLELAARDRSLWQTRDVERATATAGALLGG